MRTNSPPSLSASPTSTGPQRYLRLEEAAERLALSVQALQARCRRAAVREGGRILARLGPCVAVKLGTHWRFLFLEEESLGGSAA